MVWHFSKKKIVLYLISAEETFKYLGSAKEVSTDKDIGSVLSGCSGKKPVEYSVTNTYFLQ